MEAAMSWDEPVFIPELNLGTAAGLGGVGTIEKKNMGKFMLGFDYYWDAPYLNRTNNITITGQYFGQYVFDYDDHMCLAMNDPEDDPDYGYEKVRRYESTLTLSAGTEYFNSMMDPEIFIAYMPDGNWMIQPTLTFNYAEWELCLKSCHVTANSLNNFGPYREHDFVSMSVKYYIN